MRGDQDAGSMKSGCCHLCVCKCGKCSVCASSLTSRTCWAAHKLRLYSWSSSLVHSLLPVCLLSVTCGENWHLSFFHFEDDGSDTGAHVIRTMYSYLHD